MKVCSVCRRCYDNFDVSCIDAAHPTLSETHAGGREIVEGYSLDTLLESGPRGEIFQAHQLATNASCLIRIITTSEKEHERTVREAKAAASIFHPNIADVYDAGALDGGRVYIVSEYPAGKTLRQMLYKVRIPELLTSISILSQTAEALHTLHQNGITHNAIRPENLVLASDPDGQVQVRVQNIDHGGVGFRAIISNKFVIDSALDSLRYFAPEQCTGESAGPQTDVYSLGIVFYEMLAGSPPFDASTATALIHKQRNERPRDVRIENFQLRMLLTHTLMESLQKQPMYRPASADKFARQMRHMEQLATHVSTPPPAGAVNETAPRPMVVTAPEPAPSKPMPVVINVPEHPPVLFEEGVSEPRPSKPIPAVVNVPEHPPASFEEAVSEPRPSKPMPVVINVPEHPPASFEEAVSEPKPSKPMPVVINVPEHPPVLFEEAVPEPKPSKPMPVVINVPEHPPASFEEAMPPVVKPVPVIAKEPVREAATVEEPRPVRETVVFADPIPDPLPEAKPEPIRATTVVRDSIPDPSPSVEPKPVPAPVVTELLESELLMDSIPDPLPVFDPEPVLSLEPERTSSVDVAREEASKAPRRSRLKTWKKKLHAMSSSISRPPHAEKSALVVETPEIITNDAPIEMSIVESPTTDDKLKIVAPEVTEPRAESLRAATPEAAPVADDKLNFVVPPSEPKPVEAAVTNQLTINDTPKVAPADVKPAGIKFQFVNEAATVPPVEATKVEVPIELATLELPPEMQAETKVDKAQVSVGEVTRVETRQTSAPTRRKAAKSATKAATPTAAKAPAADTSIKRNPPRPVKAETLARNPAPQPISHEPVTTEPPRLVVEERVVQATPKKIQWALPDDDIPSEAEVLDVLVKDGMIDESEKYAGRVFTITTPKSADGPLPAPKVAPPPVSPPKSADGPVVTAAPERKTEARPVAKVRKPVPSAGTQVVRNVPPPSVVDQEEITLVRPPRQIRIDIDKRASQTAWTPPRPTSETDFFPTLLGESERPSHIQPPPPTEAMFSTYYAAPVKKTPIPYRTVMFGGGVLVLVVTFLIGDGFVGDHVQSKNESVASRTTVAPRAKKVPPTNKALEKPRDETVVEEAELKPLPDNDRLTRTIADKPGTVEKTAAVKKDTPKSATRDYVAPRPVPPPTPAVSKPKSEPVQQTRVIGIKSSPAQTNPNIATRPRVVKDPK